MAVVDWNRLVRWRALLVGDAWHEIPHPRYTEVWDRFDEAFAFRPSVRPADWPTFREPSPSVTYSIADLLREFDTWRDARATPYNLGLLRSLQACVPEGEPVLALDWQHRAYEFCPHRFVEANDPDNWCIPALPSGEYHIFVTADLRLGSLGHPWEGSVCVFGDVFVSEYSKHSPLGRDRIMRRRGAARLAESTQRRTNAMTTVTIEKARAQLSELIHRLTPGEELVITENDLPVAKLVGTAPKEPRKVPKLGTQRGSVLSMEHFDDPLEDFKEYTA